MGRDKEMRGGQVWSHVPLISLVYIIRPCLKDHQNKNTKKKKVRAHRNTPSGNGHSQS